MNKRRNGLIVALVVIVALIIFAIVSFNTCGVAGEDYEPKAYSTVFSLLPPVIAIGLALITKEVYSSLFVGAIVGGLLYANGNLELMITTMFYSDNGMVNKIANKWNAGILIFLVVLGIMVAILNKAGGSAAFGRWASKHIKTRIGAQIATMMLGVLIFIDDYFNCLTVGSVMRPVTDKHNVSRAKLAYIIDATAAPVCIIAPISSWAAAVSSSVPEDSGINGFKVFIETIPYNLYAILTLVMVVFITVLKVDFGSMKKHEINAIAGDLYTTPDRPFADAKEETVTSDKARVIDLVMPVAVLIVACFVFMIYSGGFFRGDNQWNVFDAFGAADASVGLVYGGIVALVFTFVWMMLRGILTFGQFAECIPEGFKAMVAPILILVLAWTLSGMTNNLGADVYVADLVEKSAGSFQGFLPLIIFLIAAGLAFATGTSWGTFGILIPIIVSVFPSGQMMVISISACLAGAVAGDHCSPISDTTIMASAGAQCNHVNHVSTQLPYVGAVVAVCCVGYAIIGVLKAVGLLKLAIIATPISIVLLIGLLFIIRSKAGKEDVSKAK